MLIGQLKQDLSSIRDEEGHTALHLLCLTAIMQIKMCSIPLPDSGIGRGIRYLIDHGLDATIRDNSGRQAIDYLPLSHPLRTVLADTWKEAQKRRAQKVANDKDKNGSSNVSSVTSSGTRASDSTLKYARSSGVTEQGSAASKTSITSGQAISHSVKSVTSQSGTTVSPAVASVAAKLKPNSNNTSRVEAAAEGKSKANKDIYEAAENASKAGQSAYAAGDYQQAIAHYTRSMQLAMSVTNNERQVATALTNRAQAYCSLGNDEAAMADARQSIHIDPSWAEVIIVVCCYNTIINNVCLLVYSDEECLRKLLM